MQLALLLPTLAYVIQHHRQLLLITAPLSKHLPPHSIPRVELLLPLFFPLRTHPPQPVHKGVAHLLRLLHLLVPLSHAPQLLEVLPIRLLDVVPIGCPYLLLVVRLTPLNVLLRLLVDYLI